MANDIATADAGSAPVVDTAAGKLRGASAAGIHSFKGIPYAASPTGRNRFMPPEAPQPWGPWSFVFDADNWDVGPGDSASFPPKWISADGQTLHLVFSGDDCFSVRKATLVFAETRTPERTHP